VRRVVPRITRVNELWSSDLFALEAIEVQFGSGEARVLERLVQRRPHSVLMVAVTDSREVLLVREFSPGVGRPVLRVPSGRVDDGETPIAAARRELCEEIGLDSGCQQVIHRFHDAAGHSDAFTDVVLLTDLRPRRLPGDEPEPLQQVVWPLSDLDSLFDEASATDVRTIAALLLVERALGCDATSPSAISRPRTTSRMAARR
jgi:ADP-ribose diphosphatase